MELTDNVIDIRDVIERFEELEDIEVKDDEDDQEYQAIEKLLKDLEGNGGDEKWRGSWYPLTLIKDDYFEDYCEELVSDIGDMPREIPPYIVIDWEKTAENIKIDYFLVDVNGQDYWTR